MKIIYVIFLILPLTCYSFPSSEKPVGAPEDSEIASKEPSKITKRSGGGSGSFDFLSHLKSGLLGGIGKASASLSSGSSGASSGPKHVGYHGHGNSVDFDPWTLKKSVLNTIFQAVKAITGGVTAIKGQLIKGSGYALAASGNLVAASGDKVTDVGKAIVHSAQLVHPSPHEHGSYGHSGGGSAGHPFAKFSSLSGASSSSSSGSSSGHHPSGSGESHGETVETYEVPSGPPAHHPNAQYGPPAVQKPSGFHGGFSGGPSYAGAAAYEGPLNYHQHYQGHTGPTGVASSGSAKTNYYEYPLTKVETEKATLALEEIIHLLPLNKKTVTKTITATTGSGGSLNSNTHDSTHTNQATSSSHYNSNSHNNAYDYNNQQQQQQQQQPHQQQSNHLGPIDAIAVTQTLTTAYGLPKDFDPNSTGTAAAVSPQSAPSATIKQIQTQHTIKQPEYNSHPYDVYHTMSDKYKTQQHKYIDTHQQEIQNFQSQLSQSYQNNNQNSFTNSQQQFNDNHNSNSGATANSLGPILVALGATNTYPFKRDVSHSLNSNSNSKYNPERVKNYLRQLNPQLMASVATPDTPNSPTTTNHFHGPYIPAVTSRNDRFQHRTRILPNRMKFNGRPVRSNNKYMPSGKKEVFHLNYPIRKPITAGNMVRNSFPSSHGFDGQNFYTFN